jgi:predicted amidohydrolase
MENTIVACVQQRMRIAESQEDFEFEAKRFLHQARAKSAQLVLFPELAGLMLVPPLASRLKLGLMKKADEASRPNAGLLSRGLGRVTEAAADLLGGGFRGSLIRLLQKNSAALLELYLETFGKLAREFGTAIVAGSLYVTDEETTTIRNRAYLLNAEGHVLGYQDKLNLSPDEANLAVSGSELRAIETPFGRLGLLMGRDILYPELARLLVIQGAELLAGIVASPGVAQAAVLRQALALRAEENQVFAAGSFLLGPNYLGQDPHNEYAGQSALLAPISLTSKGNGILVQAGSNRTQSFVAAELDAGALHALWETSRFRPRHVMNLGSLSPVLAEMYERGLTLEQAIAANLAGLPEPYPPAPLEPEWEPEQVDLEEIVPPAEEEAPEPDQLAGPWPETVEYEPPMREPWAAEPDKLAEPELETEAQEPIELDAWEPVSEEFAEPAPETEGLEPELEMEELAPLALTQPPLEAEEEDLGAPEFPEPELAESQMEFEPAPLTEGSGQEAESAAPVEADEEGSSPLSGQISEAWTRFRRGRKQP